MIITITGKPCSGKGTVGKLFCEKYNFEYYCTGDMFRKISKELGYDNFLDFQKSEVIYQSDKLIDDKTIEIGKKKLNENILFDSRMAWHLIPKSFKVFIDVSWEESGRRLLVSDRDIEKSSNLEDAIGQLQDRWKVENFRYNKLYSVDNTNLDNYDLVISSDNRIPEDIVEEIYSKYTEFINKI